MTRLRLERQVLRESGQGIDKRARAPYDPRMCIICIDFDRGALKPKEARRALGEMREKLDAAHVVELEKKLSDAEQQPPVPPSTP